MKSIVLIMLTTLMSLSSFAQQAEAEKHAVKTYFQNQECSKVLLETDSLLKIKTIEFTIEQKFADSLAMEFNILKHDATAAIKKEKQNGKWNKTLVKFLVPIVVAETVVIILKLVR